MRGAATKARPLRIGEEREQSRWSLAAFGCGGRLATGSREFSTRPGAQPGSRTSRPLFAKRTPAAESQTRRPHPFFSSLLGAPPLEVEVQLRPGPPGGHAEITDSCQDVEDVQGSEGLRDVLRPLSL